MKDFPKRLVPSPFGPTPQTASCGESSTTSASPVLRSSAAAAGCASTLARIAARITSSLTSLQSFRISSGRARCSARPIRAASSGAHAARIRSIASAAAGSATPLNFCAW